MLAKECLRIIKRMMASSADPSSTTASHVTPPRNSKRSAASAAVGEIGEVTAAVTEIKEAEGIPLEEPPKKKAAKTTRKKKGNDPVNPFIHDYDEEETQYYKKLTYDEKARIVATEKQLERLNNCVIPLRFRILLSEMDEHVKAIAFKKFSYLSNLDESSSEYYKILNWIHSVCELPINKYRNLPVRYDSPIEDIKHFITNIRDRLDAIVYGHKDAKEQIIRLLAQWVSNPDARGMTIGIQGPMGSGKTSLIKDGICQVLGLPFAFIPLGGANDGSYLEGHSYTYEGSTWGKIVDVLKRCKCMNPVFFFDELDKVSTTHRGDEIINILIHLTDSSQNDAFHDKYFTDFEFDLSKSLIIFSYNDEQSINPILRDRMIRIHTNGYGLPEKIPIARDYMFPQILREYNFKPEHIRLSDDIVRHIIEQVEEEKGVRNLKRALQNIVSHLNLERILDTDWMTHKTPYVISMDDVKKYINNKKTFSTLPFMYT